MRAPSRRTQLLVLLVLVGTVLRVAGSFRYPGVRYDIVSLRTVGDAVLHHPLHVYDAQRWPYGPVYFPLAALAVELSGPLHLAFSGLVRFPVIVADAVTTVLVADLLRLRGKSLRVQLAGAGLISLGPLPVFIVVAHGQIDGLAFAFVVGALWVWQREPPRRVLLCGLLIGLGAATKTTPLFCLLAFLPLCGSRKQRLQLVGAAIAVPALLLVPWALSEPTALLKALTSNSGVPGFGSWSLLVQPSLADGWIEQVHVVASSQTLWVTKYQNFIVAVPLLLLFPLLWRRRLDPAAGVCLLFLVLLVVNPNLAYQYLLWALLPMAAAGLLVESAIVSAVFILPAWILYFRPHNALTDSSLYRVLALLAWAALVVLSAVRLRQAWRSPGRQPAVG